MISMEPNTTQVNTENRDVLRLSLAAGQWQFINMFAQQLITIGTFLVLARILLPQDFGVAVLIALVPTFIDGITSFAFETSALQKKEGMRPYLDVIWTFNILRTLVILLISFIAAPFVADFFHIEYALPALYMAGLVVFAQNLTNIGQGYFFLNFDFKKIFYRDVFQKIVYSVTAISLAIILHSFWAIFLATVVSAAAGAAITYALHPYRPSLDFAFRKLEDLRSFSQWLFGQEMMAQLERTVGDSVIGRFMTPADLGLFGKAKSLAMLATSPIISSINKVSFSSYLHVRDSLPHIGEGISKTFEILFAIGLPYVLAIVFAGNRLVLVLLGPNWTPLTPSLKVLTVAATINALTVILASAVFNGIGKPRIQFAVGLIYTAVTLSGFFLLVPTWGILGASYAALFGVLAAASITVYFILTRIPINLYRITWTVVIVALASALPIEGALYLLDYSFFNTTLGYILLFALAGSVYALTITLFGLVLKRGPYSTLKLVVMSVLGNILVRPKDSSDS